MMEGAFKDKEEAYIQGYLDGKRDCRRKWAKALQKAAEYQGDESTMADDDDIFNDIFKPSLFIMITTPMFLLTCIFVWSGM